MKRTHIFVVAFIGISLSLSAADFNAAIGRDVAKLLASRLQYRDVSFTVEDEIITVTGKVATWSMRTDLQSSLERIQHVRKVRNELVLDPPAVSDEVLKGRMAKVLTTAGFTHINFRAHEGLVTLTGTVRNRAQWARIKDLAWSVEGVREVVTHVRVAEE